MLSSSYRKHSWIVNDGALVCAARSKTRMKTSKTMINRIRIGNHFKDGGVLAASSIMMVVKTRALSGHDLPECRASVRYSRTNELREPLEF